LAAYFPPSRPKISNEKSACVNPSQKLLDHELFGSQLLKSDGMRRPVSDGMLYAPKLSTCFEAQEIKETGNEEG
jgi:hypothetical protein